MLVKHPDGGLCSTTGNGLECKHANCVYYQYGYLSKCVNRREQLSSNIKES